MVKQNEKDALYTLIERVEDIKREENMKKYIVKQAHELKMERLQAQKKKTLTKETQERLYKPPETSIRKEKEKALTKETQERLYKPLDTSIRNEKEKAISEAQKDRESSEFVQRLTNHYKAARPHDRGYVDPAQLMEHWKSLMDKVIEQE